MTSDGSFKSDPIAAKEAEIAEMRRSLEIAEAELRGMRIMLARLPGHKAQHVPPMAMTRRTSPIASQQGLHAPIGYRGGRQPGAISKTWKAILRDAWLTFRAAGFTESSLIKLAELHGIRLKLSDARNRMIAYKEHGYVVETNNPQGMWLVTESAAKRFGFFEERPSPERAETETAPNVAAVGAV